MRNQLSRVANVAAWHGKSASLFDPAELNDDIADNTAWTPLETHSPEAITDMVLIPASGTRIELRPPKRTPLASTLSLAIGFLLVAIGAIMWSAHNNTTALFAVGGIGLVLLALGILTLFMKPFIITFDLDTGSYSGLSDRSLQDIYAVQTVPKKAYYDLRRSDALYYNVEMNLVFTDGSRENLMIDWDVPMIRETAEYLAGFLQVPLWDTTHDLDISEDDLLGIVNHWRQHHNR